MRLQKRLSRVGTVLPLFTLLEEERTVLVGDAQDIPEMGPAWFAALAHAEEITRHCHASARSPNHRLA